MRQAAHREYSRLGGNVGILALHGGGIEPGTEQLARYLFEQTGASLYIFSGRLASDNRTLHIPSHLTGVSPRLRRFLEHVDTAISLHGHRRDECEVYVGGQNRELARRISQGIGTALGSEYRVLECGEEMPEGLEGTSPDNSVNSPRKKGVQIELPSRLRKARKSKGFRRHEHSVLCGTTAVLGSALAEIIREEMNGPGGEKREQVSVLTLLRRRIGLLLALLTLLLLFPSCQGRGPVTPGTVLRVASVDSLHLNLGIDEAVSGASTTDPSQYSLTLGSDPTSVFGIDSAAVESLYGQIIQLRLTGTVPDSAVLRVSLERISYLNGISVSPGGLHQEFVSGLSYRKDIAPLFAQKCDGCHSGPNRSGNYSTVPYDSLFGGGTTPAANLIPGNPNCALVYKVQPRGASYPERDYSVGGRCFSRAGLSYFEAQMTHNWVVHYLARS